MVTHKMEMRSYIALQVWVVDEHVRKNLNGLKQKLKKGEQWSSTFPDEIPIKVQIQRQKAKALRGSKKVTKKTEKAFKHVQIQRQKYLKIMEAEKNSDLEVYTRTQNYAVR